MRSLLKAILVVVSVLQMVGESIATYTYESTANNAENEGYGIGWVRLPAPPKQLSLPRPPSLSSFFFFSSSFLAIDPERPGIAHLPYTLTLTVREPLCRFRFTESRLYIAPALCTILYTLTHSPTVNHFSHRSSFPNLAGYRVRLDNNLHRRLLSHFLHLQYSCRGARGESEEYLLLLLLQGEE